MDAGTRFGTKFPAQTEQLPFPLFRRKLLAGKEYRADGRGIPSATESRLARGMGHDSAENEQR